MKQNAVRHKETYCCPLDKCNYTSRIMIRPFPKMDNKISNHSENCPKHRLKLVKKITQ